LPRTVALALLLLSVFSLALLADADRPGAGGLPAISSNDNRATAGTLKDGVLTVVLELREGLFHPEADDGPSLVVQAFGEAGRPLQIPGPLIRVQSGTEIRATVRNTLADSTLILYGLFTRPGAPGDTIQVAPGAAREVRFEAGAPGTYYYWGTTTGKSLEQRETIDGQLSGALIVDPPGTPPPVDERVFVIGLWFQPADSSGAAPTPEREAMFINGKSWPYTERLSFVQGDSVRWRWVNASSSPHPMHLHGFYYHVDSRGSWAADTLYVPSRSRLVATELMPVGGTMAVRWVPARPGNWVFHCHFAFHVSHELALPSPAEASASSAEGHAGDAVHGMAGLVLGIQVAPAAGHGESSGSAQESRRLRLVIQSAPGRYGDDPGLGFALQEGAAGALPADSIAIPGPLLLLRRDEPVAITVVNHLAEPSAVHWHGIELESFPDGVPGWSGTPGRTMPPIAPGDSFVAEFAPPRSGTFIYHSHMNEQRQINSGMSGPLIVLDPGTTFDPETDRVILVSPGGPGDDAPGLVNGSESPPPIDLVGGTTYRLRLININTDWRVLFTLLSPDGLATWRPVAKDGADLPPEQAMPCPAWLLTGPGETADFEFTPEKAGELRLQIATVAPGWQVPVVVRVREASGG
jgi:FtsP/CotA-like multicopper oxidase with cupredoxin domain